MSENETKKRYGIADNFALNLNWGMEKKKTAWLCYMMRFTSPTLGCHNHNCNNGVAFIHLGFIS